MSFLLVAPEILESAAADITQIGSTVGAGNLAAAIPTTQLTAAASDEVSAAIAAVFGAHAKEYQAAAALADVRILTTAPQFASYDILQAFLTGNPATIVNAIRDGVLQVGTATIEFPLAVAQSLIDAVTGS